jgi:hypothetical protein
MFKRRYIEIKKPLPLKEQETTYNRMRGERWRADTSEPAVARALQRQGHEPVGDDGAGHYLRFELPANALTIRSLFALNKPYQAKNLPNGSSGADERVSKSTKAGRNSEQDRPIDNEEYSSSTPTKVGSVSVPKSPKGEEATDDGFEASIMAKISRSDGDSS